MYTYLLGWTSHNKYYYGVRYAKKANPADLWTTYFTSSKYVKEFCSLNGDPDIIEIREKMKNKPKDTSRYKEAALKKWANKELREKICLSMRVPKKLKGV
jgi:hypothetical protein